MEITYDKLNANWDRNGSFILHYINSKNDIMFSKERLLNVFMVGLYAILGKLHTYFLIYKDRPKKQH